MFSKMILHIYTFDNFIFRKYRVSYMDPFASNVGFLLLDCVEEPMERIMLLHQERPVKLPKCDREDCDWQKFKEIYAVR